MPKAVVIGAGIGGLATAIRLKAKKYDVLVLEANEYPGGKLHAKKQNGFRFDLGPSLITMPNNVDELYELHGKKHRTYFNYKKKNTICNYFWDDGTRFSADAEHDKFVSTASAVFGEAEVNIERYLALGQKKYDLTASLFLEKSLHKRSTFLSKDTLKAILHLYYLDISLSLHETNSRAFSSK